MPMGFFVLQPDLDAEPQRQQQAFLGQINSHIEESISGGFTGPAYTARLMDLRKDCTDGVWVIELDYILTQYE